MRPRSCFRSRRRPRFAFRQAFGLLGPALLVPALIVWPTLARAAPLVLEGPVPDGGPDHFFVEFDVPEGTREIEVRHSGESDANILDWGLDDPNGFRGWGGGNAEPAVVSDLAASRSYLPGPLPAGTWRVVVGKAKIVASPATYHIEIDRRTTPTLPPAEDRKPYVAAAPRRTDLRYYAGDFHVHSRDSGDAQASIGDDVALAKSRGLDFIELSDHNTVSQDALLAGIQEREPDFLLIPGIEFTTYAGHANAIGATAWIDHKIGQPGITIEGAVDAILRQGAVFSINHPVLDLGDLCIGCAWKHDVDPNKMGGVEIATLGWNAGGRILTPTAIAYWDSLLDRGAKIPALGGSDDHRAGASTGSFPAKIGSPTTLVRARELSVAGILEGIRKGATVVKLDGPDDPMIELEALVDKGAGEAATPIGFPGDTIGARSIVLRAKVTGAVGQSVRFVQNGHPPVDAVTVTEDPFVYEVVVSAPMEGEDRFRAEALVDGETRTVTSHLWLRYDRNGPTAIDRTPSGDSGCGVVSPSGKGRRTSGPAHATGSAVVVGLVAASLLGLRRRTRAAD